MKRFAISAIVGKNNDFDTDALLLDIITATSKEEAVGKFMLGSNHFTIGKRPCSELSIVEITDGK